MSVVKVTISIDVSLLKRVDSLVRSRAFSNSSQLIQQLIEEKFSRLWGTRLARECAQLDPTEEQDMADDGLVKV
jgi:metal-responsive CopG/Arc/MetJ family transcriptional regulator